MSLWLMLSRGFPWAISSIYFYFNYSIFSCSFFYYSISLSFLILAYSLISSISSESSDSSLSEDYSLPLSSNLSKSISASCGNGDYWTTFLVSFYGTYCSSLTNYCCWSFFCLFIGNGAKNEGPSIDFRGRLEPVVCSSNYCLKSTSCGRFYLCFKFRCAGKSFEL